MNDERRGADPLFRASMAGSSVGRRCRGAIVRGIPGSCGRVGPGRVGSAPSDMEFIANWDGIHGIRSSGMRRSKRSVPIR